MDEAPEPDAEMPGAPGPRGGDPAPTGDGPGLVGQPLVGPEAEALAAEAADIRRLVDAGAGSPEELRALAERLRAHRAREDALWRAQVKPTLKPKRASIGTPRLAAPDDHSA